MSTHTLSMINASCKVKEYGLSRELKRFMSIQITTDRFHEANHSTCSEAFKSSMYDSLRGFNSEAVEQTNHLLRSITSSTTFMSPKLYLRSIKLFMAHLNIVANMKKKNKRYLTTLAFYSHSRPPWPPFFPRTPGRRWRCAPCTCPSSCCSQHTNASKLEVRPALP